VKNIISYIRHHFNEIGKAFLFLLSLVIILLIFPDNVKFKYEFQTGKPWMYEDLIAPFDFAILKSKEKKEKEKEKALQQLIPYYQYDTSIRNTTHNILNRRVIELFNKRYSGNLDQNQPAQKNIEILFSLIDPLLQSGILKEEINDSYSSVYLLHNNIARKRSINDFYTVRTATKFLLDSIHKIEDIDKSVCIQALKGLIQPNVFYDKAKTESEKENLFNTISPFVGMVQKGERIISKGELVSEDKYAILSSMKKEYTTIYGKQGSGVGLRLGQFILILVALSSLFVFLIMIKQEVFVETKKVAFILLLLTLMIASTAAMIKYNANYLYVLPITLFPILLRVFFDVRLAIFVYIIGLLLASVIVPNSFEFVFFSFFTGITGILSVLKLSKRSQFYKSAAFIFLAYTIIYLGLLLVEEGRISGIQYPQLIYFAISSILTLFAYPLIFGFEKLFGFVTDITLMELSNTNNPILRELSVKAPGTFQHCIQVGNLAEEAIYEIGGNPLLVRAGAMYHDIGKIYDPQFFIENQSTGINPHEDLDPEESAQIILGHVLDGIKLAKKHKLPSPIIDFIRTHHGTQKAEYFWRIAKQENPDEEIDIEYYTYPGPAPFSKETAVLMMADSIEAASRSIVDPDEEKLSKLIDSIIQKQMNNKQFDNANITLKDISKIKKIFRRKLMSIYHLRIKYPE
jgi:putative nucleotidyltransferase with HDIG domain